MIRTSGFRGFSGLVPSGNGPAFETRGPEESDSPLMNAPVIPVIPCMLLMSFWSWTKKTQEKETSSTSVDIPLYHPETKSYAFLFEEGRLVRRPYHPILYPQALLQVFERFGVDPLTQAPRLRVKLLDPEALVLHRPYGYKGSSESWEQSLSEGKVEELAIGDRLLFGPTEFQVISLLGKLDLLPKKRPPVELTARGGLYSVHGAVQVVRGRMIQVFAPRGGEIPLEEGDIVLTGDRVFEFSKDFSGQSTLDPMLVLRKFESRETALAVSSIRPHECRVIFVQEETCRVDSVFLPFETPEKGDVPLVPIEWMHSDQKAQRLGFVIREKYGFSLTQLSGDFQYTLDGEEIFSDHSHPLTGIHRLEVIRTHQTWVFWIQVPLDEPHFVPLDQGGCFKGPSWKLSTMLEIQQNLDEKTEASHQLYQELFRKKKWPFFLEQELSDNHVVWYAVNRPGEEAFLYVSSEGTEKRESAEYGLSQDEFDPQTQSLIEGAKTLFPWLNEVLFLVIACDTERGTLLRNAARKETRRGGNPGLGEYFKKIGGQVAGALVTQTAKWLGQTHLLKTENPGTERQGHRVPLAPGARLVCAGGIYALVDFETVTVRGTLSDLELMQRLRAAVPSNQDRNVLNEQIMALIDNSSRSDDESQAVLLEAKGQAAQRAREIFEASHPESDERLYREVGLLESDQKVFFYWVDLQSETVWGIAMEEGVVLRGPGFDGNLVDIACGINIPTQVHVGEKIKAGSFEFVLQASTRSSLWSRERSQPFRIAEHLSGGNLRVEMDLFETLLFVKRGDQELSPDVVREIRTDAPNKVVLVGQVGDVFVTRFSRFRLDQNGFTDESFRER